MKGIVWGLTFERANEKLTEIVEKYLQMEYHIIEKTVAKNQVSVVFNNGDSWQAVAARQHDKRERCNISYIDKQLEKYVSDVFIIIKQCTTAMPFNGVTYF
jgi:hypothetical protein